MKKRQLAVASAFLFLALALPASVAVNQPAVEPPSVELYPGQSSVVTLVYFSDRSFATYLQFSASGEGYQLLSFEPSAQLMANGVYYLRVNASVPQSFPYSGEYRPRIKVVELQPLQTGTGQILDAKERELRVVVPAQASSGGTDSAETTSAESGDSTSSSSNTGTSSTDSSDASTTDSASSGAQQTDAGTSGATASSNGTQASDQNAGPLNQTGLSGRGWVVDRVVCASVSPESAGRCGERVCRQLRDGEESGLQAYGTERACLEQIDRLERQDEIEKKRANKAAARIERLQERAESRLAEAAERHEFLLERSGLSRVDVDFNSEVAGVSIVASPLSIEGATDESGVVTEPVDLRGEEESDGRKIEVSGELLPDVQERVVSEAVVGQTPVGEVVRKVTKKKAYKYLDISLEGADPSQVEGATVRFSVPSSWLSENGLLALDVRLNRLVSGEWVELPTSFTGQEDGVYLFEAQSPGFSFFVITAAITADVTTPVSVEVPTIPAEEAQDGDVVGDLVGTSKPQPVLILNISWIVVVIGLGIVVLWKWNDIKRAMGFVHAKENRIRELESEKSKYERMKDETTKKFYKRAISEDEFKNLAMEYDKNIIRIDTEIADLRGQKPEEKKAVAK